MLICKLWKTLTKRAQITYLYARKSQSTVRFWGFFYSEWCNMFLFKDHAQYGQVSIRAFIILIISMCTFNSLTISGAMRTVSDYAYTSLRVCVFTIHSSMTSGGHEYIQKCFTLFMFDRCCFDSLISIYPYPSKYLNCTGDKQRYMGEYILRICNGMLTWINRKRDN